MKEKTVDAYVAGLEDWQAEIVTSLRQIVRAAAPNAAESFKWAQPVYEENGPFAFIKAFRDHVNFGFWRGADFPDPLGILEGVGDRMRHVRLSSVKDIRKKAFADMVKMGVQLNRTRGDPTKSRTK